MIFDVRSIVYGLLVLVEEEGESPGPARHGIHLELDALNLTVRSKIFFEVILTDLLGKPSNKQFSVLLIICHFVRTLHGF